MTDTLLRPAVEADAEQVASVYLTSRKTLVPFAPPAHSDDEVRGWLVALIADGNVFVAVDANDTIVGMMAIAKQEGVAWIDQLYVHPSAVGRGLGTRFVEHAKKLLGSPIRLYTFQENAGSRRFYERHGFRVIELGDGSGNEEHCPDVLYEWLSAAAT